MKMMKKSILLLVNLLFCLALFAQPGKLDVTVNGSVFKANDTIDIICNYSVNNVKPKVATLFARMVNEQGQIWEMRWPLLDGYCNPAVIVPAGFEPGGYKLYLSVMQNFFTVSGNVKRPDDIKELKTMLITKGGDWLSKNISVREDGYFELRNQLFEQEATLMFQKKSGISDDLDIEIATVLDSVYAPMALYMHPVFIGPLPDGETAQSIAGKMKNDIEPDSVVSAKTQMLQAVTVYGEKKSKAQMYADQYSNGLFKTIDERIIDVMNEPNAQASGNIIQFLAGRVAGLNINGAFSFTPTASWRGGKVFFYLDQMPIDIQNLNAIPVSDVAIVKAFPPQFMGNPTGDGGAIAIYTKRGEFSDDRSRHTFRVKGYTPINAALPLVPDRY
jgi:hypothetical protein